MKRKLTPGTEPVSQRLGRRQIGHRDIRRLRQVHLIIQNRLLQRHANPSQRRRIGLQVLDQLVPPERLLVLDPLVFPEADHCPARRNHPHPWRVMLWKHRALLQFTLPRKHCRRPVFPLWRGRHQFTRGELLPLRDEGVFVKDQGDPPAHVLAHQEGKRKPKQQQRNHDPDYDPVLAHGGRLNRQTHRGKA